MKKCKQVLPMAGKRRDSGLCEGWCNNCDIRVRGFATLAKAMKAVEMLHPKKKEKPLVMHYDLPHKIVGAFCGWAKGHRGRGNLTSRKTKVTCRNCLRIIRARGLWR